MELTQRETTVFELLNKKQGFGIEFSEKESLAFGLLQKKSSLEAIAKDVPPEGRVKSFLKPLEGKEPFEVKVGKELLKAPRRFEAGIEIGARKLLGKKVPQELTQEFIEPKETSPLDLIGTQRRIPKLIDEIAPDVTLEDIVATKMRQPGAVLAAQMFKPVIKEIADIAVFSVSPDKVLVMFPIFNLAIKGLGWPIKKLIDVIRKSKIAKGDSVVKATEKVKTAVAKEAKIPKEQVEKVIREPKVPVIANANRHDSMIRLEFDKEGVIPTVKELKKIFSDPEAGVEITHFKPGIGQFVGNVETFRIDVWDKLGRLSSVEAEKLFKKVIGKPVTQGSKRQQLLRENPELLTRSLGKGVQKLKEKEIGISPKIEAPKVESITSEVSPKPIQTKKAISKLKGTKVSVLPRKKALLKEIDEAIKKAPDGEVRDKTVSFKIDGGAEVFNDKTALGIFRKNIKKTPQAVTLKTKIATEETISEKFTGLDPFKLFKEKPLNPNAIGVKVKDLVRERAFNIDKAFLDSEEFIRHFDIKLTRLEREALPFIRQGIKDVNVLKKIGREELIPIIKNPSKTLIQHNEKLGKYYDEAHAFLKENFDNVGFVENYVTQIYP